MDEFQIKIKELDIDLEKKTILVFLQWCIMSVLDEVLPWENRDGFIYLDIDKSYFAKPNSHWIYYRHSASGKHFHLKLKREWITEAELFNLLIQCDKAWLCHQFVQKKVKVAKKKEGREVNEDWKKTTVESFIYVLRSCGQVMKYRSYGFKLFGGVYYSISELLSKENWESNMVKELEELYLKLPKEFKATADRSYFGSYDDWDEGEDLEDYLEDDYYD